MPTCPRAVTRHPRLPSVPSLLSALSNEEKLRQWLSMFVLVVDRFLLLTVILPLNAEFLFYLKHQILGWNSLKWVLNYSKDGRGVVGGCVEVCCLFQSSSARTYCEMHRFLCAGSICMTFIVIVNQKLSQAIVGAKFSVWYAQMNMTMHEF